MKPRLILFALVSRKRIDCCVS